MNAKKLANGDWADIRKYSVFGVDLEVGETTYIFGRTDRFVEKGFDAMAYEGKMPNGKKCVLFSHDLTQEEAYKMAEEYVREDKDTYNQISYFMHLDNFNPNNLRKDVE